MKTNKDKNLNSLQVTDLLKAPVVTALGAPLPVGSVKLLSSGGGLTPYVAEDGSWVEIVGAGVENLQTVLTNGDDAASQEITGLLSLNFPWPEIKLGAETAVSPNPDQEENDVIAVGTRAASIDWEGKIVAIGYEAAETNTFGTNVIGYQAGQTNSNNGTSFGYQAGQTGNLGGLAVGYQAGQTVQGSLSIAIGYQAGQENQHGDTIVINATDTPVNTEGTQRLYIKPIRGMDSGDFTADFRGLYYDIVSNEIFYDSNAP